MLTIRLLFVLLALNHCYAQNIAGKWYGKVTQKEGGYSELYDFELDLRSGKRISGESYAYIPGTLSVRIGLQGNIQGDSLKLYEHRLDIREEKMPVSWVACIKNLNLKYFRNGAAEYLKGTWSGISKEDGDECIPGEIILSRTKADLEEFLRNDGFNRPFLITQTTSPEIEFSPSFNNTEISIAKELDVHSAEIELKINDYLNVDNDTISVYFNRQLVLSKQRISRRPISLKLNMSNAQAVNEVVLFAENLGRIPPNTSRLVITDGSQKHELIIQSDRQKSAALRLKYKP